MIRISRERGQSMVGMLVVIAIIGLVVWWSWGGGGSDGGGINPQETVEKGRKAQAEIEISTLEQAIQMYQSRKGQYPPSLEVLAEDGFAKKSAIKGPDGELYEYNPETGKVSR
jgi:competence protein ComGC